MLIRRSGDTFFLILNRRYSSEEFVRASGARLGSYAETLAKRIHNSFIERSIDVMEEYREYYAPEYDSLGRFLFWKYDLDQNSVVTISGAAESGACVLYGWANIDGDYNFGYLVEAIHGDVLERILNKTLAMLEGKKSTNEITN